MSIQHAHALSGCGPEAPNPDVSTISTCEIHSILSNRRRLFVLEELFARDDGIAEFDDLVDRVTERELEATDEDEESNWTDKRKAVRVTLYQHHMPRLKDDAIIDYERRTGAIALAANAETVARFLEVDGTMGDQPPAGLLDQISNGLRSVF